MPVLRLAEAEAIIGKVLEKVVHIRLYNNRARAVHSVAAKSRPGPQMMVASHLRLGRTPTRE